MLQKRHTYSCNLTYTVDVCNKKDENTPRIIRKAILAIRKYSIFLYKGIFIMKKTLAVAAVMAAFAGSAMADVSIYGRMDTGFAYDRAGDVDSFTMQTGQSTGNRWGVKGSEKIGDMTVGFQLEQGFNGDDGTASASTRAFHREARVFVKGAYGEFAMGRFGTLDSGAGSYNIYGGLTPFGTGWGDVGGAGTVLFGQDTRRDNAVAYVSPEFGGVKLHAMAAAANAGEGTYENDRYYAAALTYKAGGMNAALIASYRDYANDVNADEGIDDAVVLTAGLNFKLAAAKVYVTAQYFNGLDYAESVAAVEEDLGCPDTDNDDVEAAEAVPAYHGVKGYGLVLGAEAPLAGGTLYGMVGYNDSKDVEGENDYNVHQVGFGYQYPLSKNVYLYTAAGYVNEIVKVDGDEDHTEAVQVNGGLVVKF